MKKLLLITFILMTTFSFAQQKEDVKAVIQQNNPTETLTSISATPNPFTVKTTISFKSSQKQVIEFYVKNLLGKSVFSKTITTKKGLNSINFERNDISKGMYIYTLQTDSEVISKRLVIR